ncbi:hypothetical protein [Mesorhizobium sangaii]|uniref:Uncharacterized protein n=1 Tax=Mesorhizobium sangaii TaxID=505389 RepID=A0A841PGW4_9HYPH|nr:hypothetical protein [Mesorhizobium sangaii]MBB6409219.1 hypothetical protein [Mesorhizobium sangaii]
MNYAKDPRREQLVNLRQWKAEQERKAARWPAFIPRSPKGLWLLCVHLAARPTPLFVTAFASVILVLTVW